MIISNQTNQACQLNDRGRYDHPLVPLSSSAPAVHTNKTISYNAYALFIPHFISKSHITSLEGDVVMVSLEIHRDCHGPSDES